jgi:hypothetical protein
MNAIANCPDIEMRSPLPAARAITIFSTSGGWAVHEGERHSGALSWDEMLGQIASLTLPPQANRIGGLFGMRLPEEWAAHRLSLGRRRYMPTKDGLPDAVLDGLRMFAREFGQRGGEFDELLPWHKQYDYRVRLALMLLDACKEYDPSVVDAEVSPHA